jgi:hypothetical protein
MKKKVLWIAALFAALTLMVTGCPTGGGDEPPPEGSGETPDFYVSDTEGGNPAENNQVTLTAKGNVYVYFKAPGANFDKIKVTYNVDPGQNLTYAALYDTHMSGTEEKKHTWGISNWETDWKGGPEDIVAEIDPSGYGDKWSASGDSTQNSRPGIDKTKIYGLCINFDDITDGVRVVFKLKNVELTGLDYKGALNTSITAAEALVSTEYTQESWAALQIALTAAKAAYAKTDATPSELTLAKGVLDASIKALVPAGAVDKTALNALITTAETKNEADYTALSWYAFAEALEAAKEASQATNMGQTAINNAKNALQAAMDALVPAMYFNKLYIGTTLTTSTVTIDDSGSSVGVTVSSGSIKVPSVLNNSNNKTETRLYLKIDPAVDITSYGDITFEWSGHSNASFNISLDMSGRRLMMKDASGASTTFNFGTDVPSWAAGWGDAAIGSLSGIEVYSENAGITELTISKITIAGDPIDVGGGDGGPVIFDGSAGGFVDGASVETSSFVTATANNITITWDSADKEGEGALRAQINLASAAQVDLTSYSKFKFNWEIPGKSGWVGCNYNITLTFSGNRILSAYAGGNDGAGTAEFDLVEDIPEWAAGTAWGGADIGILKGLEIYSEDKSTLETASLVITKIWFE